MTLVEEAISPGAPRLADRRERVVSGAFVVARISVSLAIAAALAFILRGRLGRDRMIRTDIVGYPIHSDFNVEGYFATFTCAAVIFPVAAIVIEALLGGIQRRRWPFRFSDRPAAQLPAWEPRGSSSATAAVLSGGGAIGALIAAGIAWLVAVEAFWPLVLLGAAAGSVGPGVLLRGRQDRLAAVGRVVAMAMPTSILSVAAASASASVFEAPSSRVRNVDILPTWVVLLVAAVSAFWTIRRVRMTSDAEVPALVRRLTLGIAVPVAIGLLLSRIPGPMGPLDAFHEGEALAGFDLIRRGFAPWRELFFIHGLMNDVIRSGVGMFLIENSRWGAEAGQTLLLGPLYWVSQYYLLRYLIGRNGLLLLGALIMIMHPALSPGGIRFVLQPLVLLALARLLRRASPARAAVFCAIALVHWIVTPEASFTLLACGFVIVAFELWHRGDAGWVAALVRTRWCALFASLFLATWGVVLAATGTMSSYLFYFQTFATGHELTGGIPVQDRVPFLWWAIVLPALVAVLALWWFAAAARTGRAPTEQDWVALAIGLFTLLYYRKFLSRADAHAFDVLGPALPLLYYVVARTIDGLSVAASHAFGRREPGQPQLRRRVGVRIALSAGLVLAGILPTVWPRVSDRLDATPRQFQAIASTSSIDPRLGYLADAAPLASLLPDLRLVLSTLDPSGGRVFDMSNAPALFHYLLQRDPIDRYFHVSMAIRYDTQLDALEQLRQERPAVAIMDGSFGLPGWDGVPNQVRHYELSAYVLAHYRPVIRSHQFLFLLRDDLPTPDVDALATKLSDAATTDLLDLSLPCAWGEAAEAFTDPGWRRVGAPTEVELAPGTALRAVGWAADPTADGRPARVLAVARGELVGAAITDGNRPDVVAATGSASLAVSGFSMAIVVPPGVEPRDIRFYAVSHDGRSMELARSTDVGAAGGAAPSRVPTGSGETLVLPGAVGSVDALTHEGSAALLHLPGRPPAAFSHLEFEVSTRGKATYELRSRLGPANGITFAIDSDGPDPYVVRVDNCPQWHSLGETFVLLANGPMPTAVRAWR